MNNDAPDPIAIMDMHTIVIDNLRFIKMNI